MNKNNQKEQPNIFFQGKKMVKKTKSIEPPRPPRGEKTVPDIKPPKAAQNPVDETYFVSLKSPLELRRQILESSRKTIYCMQTYQKVMLIRQRKLQELESLKQSLKELMYLNKKLNEKLPSYDHELVPETERVTKGISKIIKKAEVKPVPEKKSVKEKTELEKLEESLSVIEKKLGTLGKK